MSGWGHQSDPWQVVIFFSDKFNFEGNLCVVRALHAMCMEGRGISMMTLDEEIESDDDIKTWQLPAV